MPHRARFGDEADRLMKLNVDFMFLGPWGTAGETFSSACNRVPSIPKQLVSSWRGE